LQGAARLPASARRDFQGMNISFGVASVQSGNTNDALNSLLTPRGLVLIAAARRFGIGSPLEQAHFYAQCAEESQGFTKMVENLNYSAERLLVVFHRHFTPAEAADYAHHPERIANRAYANRMGNGDEASGDGWKYRGRSWPEITGKDNYARISEEIFGDDRLLTDPDLLELPINAALGAGHYWIDHHCGLPAMHDDIEAVTRQINPALEGLEQRKDWLRKFKTALEVPHASAVV
jgi:putative chitinase